MGATVDMQKLRGAGFSDAEVGEWATNKRKELSQAGFNEGEIDAHFGKPPFDPKPLIKQIKDNHAAATAPSIDGSAPKPVTSFVDALQAGFQMSVTGLVTRGQLPDKALSADAPMASRIASSLGTLGGDFPAMVGGALLGGAGGAATGPGAAITGVAGAFALPAGLRATLMDSYSKGHFDNFGDFWERASGILIDTAKGWVTGAATGGAGALAGKALSTAAPVIRTTGQTAAEVGTMVTVGSALEGHVPTARDFVDAAIIVGGLKGATKTAGKLRDIYRDTGLRPHEVVQEMQKDPTIAQDLLSTNTGMPKSFGGSPGQAAPSAKPKPDVAPTPPPKTQPEAPQTPQETILSKISVGEHKATDPLSYERLYTMAIDDLNPIRQAVKSATGGKDLPASQDPYQLARMTRGTFGKADQMLEHGTFDFHTYKNNGKPLKAILDPVRDDLNGVRAYAASKRSIELQGRGIESGLDAVAAKQVVKDGSAKYEPILRDLADYQNRVTSYLRDSGVISKEAHAAMLAANKDYVPFYRVMDTEGHGAGRGLTVSNPIKSIKGSERVVIDPLESVIKNTYMYTALAERNAVGVKFVEMANNSGRPQDFILKVKPDLKPTKVDAAEMGKFLAEHGITKPTDDLLTVFRAHRTPLAENEIAVFTDGKRSVYEVNPEIAKAFKAADSETVSLLVKILAVPAKTLRAGSVLSPDFMVRNLVRDQSSAFVLSKAGYLPVFDMMQGALSIAKRDEHFQSWLKSGGANSALVAVDRRYLQESVFKLSGETGLTDRAWNVAKSPLEVLRITSELIENSTRLGEFKKSLGDSTSKADIQQAGMNSREVTLDFGRIGSKMRAANMISAFLNAHVQGLDRTVRAMKEDPFGFTAKVGASITLPSILLYMANRDDPRFKEIPRWQKDLFWIVMTDDHIFRIPKPFELGIVFGSLPERLLESYFDDNPDAFKDMSRTIDQAFLPNMIPNFAAPVIEQFSNRSMFTGNSLIPSDMEGLLPEYQYTAYTTETTKALGSLIGAFPGLKKKSIQDQDTFVGGTARALSTPILMENYLRAWSGGLGMYALQVADKGLRLSGVLPDPEKPASTLADLPVIKAFVVRYPSATAQSIQDFYDGFSERKRSYDTVMKKAAEGDIEAVNKTLKFDQNAMVLLGGVKDTLSEQNKLIRLIYKNPDIPADEKRQLIDTLYFRMIDIAKTANEELKALHED